MQIEIRAATAADAPLIAEVKVATWPDEMTTAEMIARVLQETNHAAHTAWGDGRLAGFVDGFLTMTAAGARRWEVDLLAVHPVYRGRGLATRLVQANSGAGCDMGAIEARGLVKTGNAASERAFARCGYVTDATIYGLYIDGYGEGFNSAVPRGLHLIPVVTFNYQGVWVEGELSGAGFALAQSVRAQYGWDAAGAAIPVNLTEAKKAAEAAGYSLVGEFRWWNRSLIENVTDETS